MSTSNLLVPVSVGEIVDKITILEIKLKMIGDESKLVNVRAEYLALSEACKPYVDLSGPTIGGLKAQLYDINSRLWVIEDDIRECERCGRFDDTFIRLARAVYITNDERAEVKREINRVLGSHLVEEKSYKKYK